MSETEQQLEQRLVREAKTVYLGNCFEPGVDNSTATDVARVEITYKHDEDDAIEHCGFVLAFVRCDELDHDAPEDEQMQNHPASRAETLVHQSFGDAGFAYFSIDEVTAA